jgi:hypothetical protein
MNYHYKRYPPLSETASLRVQARYIGDFSLFNVCF